MKSRQSFLHWLFTLCGCSTRIDGQALERSAQPLTPDWEQILSANRVEAEQALRTRYSRDETGNLLTLLQHTIDDKSFYETKDLTRLGIVWGDCLVSKTDTEWVTAEWNGKRMFALNVARTSVLLFPVAMLEKRRDKNEHIDFSDFLNNTIAAIKTAATNSEYQR